jgi:hypothetical protein
VHLRIVNTTAGEVRFEVEDHGPGVSPEDQQRIFEKFSRAAGATLRGEGTGLGLYIARSLADGQGGRVHVESELGRGSTFIFVLPKAGGDIRPGGSGEDDRHDEPRPAPQPVEDGPPAEPRAIGRNHRHRSVASTSAPRPWR